MDITTPVLDTTKDQKVPATQPNRAQRRLMAYHQAHARTLKAKEGARHARILDGINSRAAAVARMAECDARRRVRNEKRAEIAAKEGVSPNRVMLVGDGYVIRPTKPVKPPKRDTAKCKRIKAARAA